MSCKRRSHCIEGRDFEDLDVIQTGDHAFILILRQQRFEHGAGLRPVLGENVTFLTLLARSRRVSGGWSKATWQIRSNGSRSLPTSSSKRIEQQTFLGQLFDDGFLALGGFPAAQEIDPGWRNARGWPCA